VNITEIELEGSLLNLGRLTMAKIQEFCENKLKPIKA
jgi:hypothetical protein